MIYLPLRSQELLVGALAVARPAADVASAQVAVIDESSQILVVNSRWREFAIRHGFADPTFGVGSNYLSVCRMAAEQGVASAARIADGILEILQGGVNKLKLFYEGALSRITRTNEVMLLGWDDDGERRVIVAHWMHS